LSKIQQFELDTLEVHDVTAYIKDLNVRAPRMKLFTTGSRDFYTTKELSTEEAKKRIQSWSTNEQFLVGKVYEYIRGAKPTVSWCFVIWNSAIPPKMSFIL